MSDSNLEELMRIADGASDVTKQSAMRKLADLANRQLALEQEIAYKEEEVKEKKKQLLNISGVEIPNLLASSGLSEIKLATGEKIVVKKGVSVSYEEKDEAKLFAYLRKNNAGDLIKTKFSIGQVKSEILDKIFTLLDETVNGEYETDMSVHARTLNKYIKELTAIDKPQEERQELYAKGVIKNVDELPEFLKVYQYSSTEIKK